MEFSARISPRKIDGLKREVERVNRKALALDCEPLALDISELKRERHPGTSRWFEFHTVTITGRLPKIAGWTLVARIDHTGPRNVITSTGLWEGEVDLKWREAAPNCDHCESLRVRNDTFILIHDNGEWAQVGRDCLSDFAGSDSPFKILRLFFDLERKIGEMEDWDEDHRSSPLIDTKIFLSHTSAIITEIGWYSKSAWESNEHTGTPTATRVMSNMFPDPQVDEDWLIEVTEEAEAEAEAALSWVRDDLASKDRLSDYEYNLVALTETPAFDCRRYTGIMASLIPAYRREHGLNGRGEKKEITSEHQGEIGKRQTWDLTVTKRVDMEVDSYGWSYSGTEMLHIHIFEDEAGNVFVWKTTSVSLNEGDSYKVKATVKAHDEYNGTPQTILSRAIAYCKDCGKNARDSKVLGENLHRINLYAVEGCWPCKVETLPEEAKEEIENG